MDRYHFGHTLRLGIPGIDAQHERLATLLQCLGRALSDGDNVTPHFRLEELLDYTQDHFQDEERFMAGAGYRGLTEHRRQHARLSTQLRKLNVQLAFHEQPPSPIVVDSLWVWFGLHVMKADRVAADWVRAKFPNPHPLL